MNDLPPAGTHLLSVTGLADVGPHLRRVTLTGDGLAELNALPGQDVVLHLGDGQGGGVSRRYTIRNLDKAARRLDLDFVLHGPGPGAQWAAAVQIGEVVEVFGPRGKVRLAAAGWQLFAGDESALPAIAEMICALPPAITGVALIEVAGVDDEQPIAGTAHIGVRWLHRGRLPPGQAELLDRALEAVELPPVDRHAYVFGESRVVRRLRDQLGRRGLGPTEISAKGYWNLGRATAD